MIWKEPIKKRLARKVFMFNAALRSSFVNSHSLLEGSSCCMVMMMMIIEYINTILILSIYHTSE